MKYLISIKRNMYLNLFQNKLLFCLFSLFKINVCKDDDFSALTDYIFINENIEKCTMMYRMATRNGIDCCNNPRNGIDCCNNPTLLIWLVTIIWD